MIKKWILLADSGSEIPFKKSMKKGVLLGFIIALAIILVILAVCYICEEGHKCTYECEFIHDK